MIYFTLQNTLLVALILVGVGLYGLLTRRNLVMVMLCVEIMLNGVNISLVAFNYFLWNGTEAGHFLYMLSIGIAAVEAAVGLSLLILIFRNYGKITTHEIARLGEKR
ncbi:MAG: NADH-quinone oxidoreductase subunit NuoK [Leptospirales bacterium]|jgi:NADH-quinone oxidoreductase subunit K